MSKAQARSAADLATHRGAKPAVAAAALERDLSDDEFRQLDGLLAATPAPLAPMNAVMFDGYVCAVLVQPMLLRPAQWLAPVFDLEGRALPDDADPRWFEQTTQLLQRRHAALRKALLKGGWFHPLIRDEVTAEQEDVATDAISSALMPWVAGFQHACTVFPELSDLPDHAAQAALARLYRHLPADGAQEREIVALLEREMPLASVDDAIEDLVAAVADLDGLTRAQRYKGALLRRDVSRVGRNDPCPCGSGKKYKQCHLNT